jgi:UDP-glucose 4-epimerase
MTETVLITGGCGFIGSHLASRLVADGYHVRLLDNLLRGEKKNVEELLDQDTVELIRGDIRDSEVVEDAVKGADYVVHLAATNLNRSIDYPGECLSVNIAGANNVFQAAAEYDIEKVLYASSASVYGDQDVPMHEDDPVDPQTPYGIAKFAGEGLLDFYADQYDLEYVGYRFFNVYGAGQDTDAYYTSVINVFIERLARGDPPVIHGSGEQSMDFVNVRDIARALQLGIESDASNDLFNVGSGESTTISTLAEILIDIMDVDLEPQYEERDVLVSERRAATEHAQKGLGFETQVDLEEGLTEVVEDVLEGLEEDI